MPSPGLFGLTVDAAKAPGKAQGFNPTSSTCYHQSDRRTTSWDMSRRMASLAIGRGNSRTAARSDSGRLRDSGPTSRSSAGRVRPHPAGTPCHPLGTVDAGRLIFAYNSVSNAAREGGRTAIVNQTPVEVRSQGGRASHGPGHPVHRSRGSVHAAGGPTTQPTGICFVLSRPEPVRHLSDGADRLHRDRRGQVAVPGDHADHRRSDWTDVRLVNNPPTCRESLHQRRARGMSTMIKGDGTMYRKAAAGTRPARPLWSPPWR